ncbi:MAG: hypothetical protein MOGMAGMI_00872 [Candidatus Omnitrophica bacterium]|nr:hypothetical protein [Candidatus Omnitrophota bacterium]
MRSPYRIVYLRTDRIGDVLMNLPALRALRLSYPKSWITLVADRPVAELLKGHPDLDEVMPVDAGALAASGRSRAALRAALKGGGFDLAIVSNPDRHLHHLVWASGIGVRLGQDRKWSFLLNKRIPAPVDPALHEIERNLRLVSAVTSRGWDGRIELPADAEIERRISERLTAETRGSKSVVLLHTGTSDPRKRWPADRWAELGRSLEGRSGCRPVVVGGPEEAAAAAEVRAACPDALDWTGGTTLRELAALTRDPRVAAMISADSGPAHIAWISGCRLVVMYPTDCPGSDPQRWGPRGSAPTAVIRRSVADITAEDVLDEWSRLGCSGKGGRA